MLIQKRDEFVERRRIIGIETPWLVIRAGEVGPQLELQTELARDTQEQLPFFEEVGPHRRIDEGRRVLRIGNRQAEPHGVVVHHLGYVGAARHLERESWRNYIVGR